MSTVDVVLGILSKAIQEVQPNVVGQRLPGTTDNNAREIEEALLGAAFAVIQAHMKTLTKEPLKADEINAIANYWKHRDQWKVPWVEATKKPWPSDEIHPHTFNIIVRKLGEAGPDQAPGQLRRMAKQVMGNLGLWQLSTTLLPPQW